MVEVNGIGQSPIDDLLEKGLNVASFLTMQTVKSHIVLNLKSALEPAKVKLFNHEIQKMELLAFEGKGTTYGSFSYSDLTALNSDCIMTLDMAWDACPIMNGSPLLLIAA